MITAKYINDKISSHEHCIGIDYYIEKELLNKFLREGSCIEVYESEIYRQGWTTDEFKLSMEKRGFHVEFCVIGDAFTPSSYKIKIPPQGE